MTAGAIKACRRRLGQTQAEFGRAIGKSQRTIAAWEAGEFRPGLTERLAIAAVENGIEPFPPYSADVEP